MSLENKEVLVCGIDYIELESVGTAVDENGITHPMFADGTIDMDEGMAVDWVETDDEWSSSLSNEDAGLLDDWLLENNYSVKTKCEKCGKIPAEITYKDKNYCTWYCAKKG